MQNKQIKQLIQICSHHQSIEPKPFVHSNIVFRDNKKNARTYPNSQNKNHCHLDVPHGEIFLDFTRILLILILSVYHTHKNHSSSLFFAIKTRARILTPRTKTIVISTCLTERSFSTLYVFR